MSKDKRIPIGQVKRMNAQAYKDINDISTKAVERVLREQFGFGAVRLERFMNDYGMIFEHEATQYLQQREKEIRRTL
jgi:hypothetical protein